MQFNFAYFSQTNLGNYHPRNCEHICLFNKKVVENAIRQNATYYRASENSRYDCAEVAYETINTCTLLSIWNVRINLVGQLSFYFFDMRQI